MNIQTFQFALLTKQRQLRVDGYVRGELERRIARDVRQFWERLLVHLNRKPTLRSVQTAVELTYPDVTMTMRRGFEQLATSSYAWSVNTWVRAIGGQTIHEDFQEAVNLTGMVIFKPLSRAEVDAIISQKVAGVTWQQRLRHWSRKISDVGALKDRLAQLYSRGANIDEMARELKPLVSMIEASARRIARTEGMRIANMTNDKTYEDAGVDEFLYHATLDDVVRPEHAADHGKVFTKKNKIPLPRGPNCRCWYSPVFSGDYKMKIDPQMRAAYQAWKGKHRAKAHAAAA